MHNNPLIYSDPTGHESASVGEKWYAFKQLGYSGANKLKSLANKALSNARRYAERHGLDSVTDNEADAYRHFTWNVEAIKAGLNKEKVANVMTNHENTRVTKLYTTKGKTYSMVPVASLMDLWNNAAGRELASLKEFRGKSTDQIFQYALDNNILITSLDQVPLYYDFDESWVFESNGETWVVIEGTSLDSDPVNIVVVDDSHRENPDTKSDSY